MDKAWRYWLIAAVFAIAASFFIPEGSQSMYYDIIGVSAAGAMFIGLWVNRAEPRSAWVLLAFGVLIFSAGDIAYGDYKPVPSVADMFYLSGYAVLGAGLVSLIRGRVPQRDRSVLLDVGAIAAAVLIASFVLLGRAYSKDVGAAGRAVAVAYPLMDLILFGMAARLARTEKTLRGCYVFLGAAFVLLLAADVGFTLENFGMTYSAGGVPDALWLLSYACLGAALLHPSLGTTQVWVPVSTAAAGAPRSPWIPAGVGPTAQPTVAVAVSAPPTVVRVSSRDPFGSTAALAFQVLKFRRVLASAGLMAMAVAAIALLLGVAWHATEPIFLSGMYGITGAVMLISSAVHSSLR